MFEGTFEDGLPRIRLTVEGRSVQFVVDTGFEGELCLPSDVVRELSNWEGDVDIRRVADGRDVQVRVYTVTLQWLDGPRETRALELGELALLGTDVLQGLRLTIEADEGCSVFLERM